MTQAEIDRITGTRSEPSPMVTADSVAATSVAASQLTSQALTIDLRMNQHHPGYRAEYHSHPFQGAGPPTQTESTDPGPPTISPINHGLGLIGSSMLAEERTLLYRQAEAQAEIVKVKAIATHLVQNNRPASTRGQYFRVQKQWVEWCQKKSFNDKDTVHVS
jgi:hypothetical protein